MAYGGAVSTVWAGPTLVFGLMLYALVLQHGAPGERIMRGFVALRVAWILVIALWLSNGLIALYAFSRLRRLEERSRGAGGKAPEAF